MALRSKDAHPSGLIVPPSTLNSVMDRLGNNEITVENCFRSKKKGLLSTELIDVLQDIIRKRDEINNGVSRKEAIQLIVDLGQCGSSKAAENHLDYLIRKGQLTGLKRGGKVVTAQSTTTERSQINCEQQLRWHFLIESEWEFMRSVNTPSSSFVNLHEHFQLNLDESCFMCNDGILKIIGAADKRHHDKNTSDSRVSITVVRCGNAAGANGPVVFLTTGQKVNRTFSNYRLHKIYGLPEGSTVLCNNSAYMDDATWIKCVKAMAPGIRAMPTIKDHPEWWACLTFDGFKSHVNVNEALQVFSDANIRAVKEEAGTSHVNQPYDQETAQADKRASRQLLEIARRKVKGNIDQWKLIGILIVAMNNLKEDVWIKSFKKVNLHPKYRVGYNEWLNKIKSHIVTGETAYTRANTTSMYDAMPAMWKNFTPETRNRILSIINTATLNEPNPWVNKSFLLRLSQFVKIDDVAKLRICHQVAKQDPSVIVTHSQGVIANVDDSDDDDSPLPEVENSTTNTTAIVPYIPITTTIVPHNPTTTAVVPVNLTTTAVVPQSQNTLATFQLKPPSLITAINIAEDKSAARMNLFNHMVTFRNRNSYKEEKQKVNDYLSCDYSSDQQTLLNPSVLDTVIGYIMHDSQGEGAKKRLPQRRLNFIDGMVSSHCSVLNSPHRLDLIRQANEVSAVMADLEAERNDAKEERKRKNAEELERQKVRRQTKEAKDREAKRNALLKCEDIMQQLDIMGDVIFESLKVAELKMFICYQFKSDEYKEKGIKKLQLKIIATRLYMEYLEKEEEIQND